MTIKYRGYCPEDFLEIRNLLVESFGQTAVSGNWLIDRWNFCRAVAHTMHDTYESWPDSVGIWEDGAGTIVGVVNSEGEQRGEAFFQLRHPLPDAVLGEMFEFTERHLPCFIDGYRRIRLRIPQGDGQRQAMAAARGYRELDWRDVMSGLCLAQLQRGALPEGFSFLSGSQITPQAKAVAHAKAFGYWEKGPAVPLAFERMTQAPDYRPELDMAVYSEEAQEIVAFCTVWLDSHNNHAILEPVGTHPGYRRLGLGRAVIGEGLSRAGQSGATKAYVGSHMDFYKALGFQPVFVSHVWEKILTD